MNKKYLNRSTKKKKKNHKIKSLLKTYLNETNKKHKKNL